MLRRSDPERAEHLQAIAQSEIHERRRYYEQLAGIERKMPHDPTLDQVAAAEAAGSVDEQAVSLTSRPAATDRPTQEDPS
jgi:hypothetical protein